MIQGIQAAEVEDTVTTMIDELGLGQYADKMAGGYSGGNKRKLSVAIAMIGDPQIVFLVSSPDTHNEDRDAAATAPVDASPRSVLPLPAQGDDSTVDYCLVRFSLWPCRVMPSCA